MKEKILKLLNYIDECEEKGYDVSEMKNIIESLLEELEKRK